ncbi:MAG: hypothetical protein HC773_10910 [Scytonema sp. CRU_2_7]|nr:hypothetical protein [Scytonema sp. CRU_2_7]
MLHTPSHVISAADRSLLDKWNQDLGDSQRYDAVTNAPSDSLFRVDKDKKRYEESPKV